MNRSNRSLLVLFNQELKTPHAIEHEVGILHELLHHVEHLENVIVSHEIIDLNKHKLYNDRISLRKAFRDRKVKGFVFLNNKN
jgi:hypothetical protein